MGDSRPALVRVGAAATLKDKKMTSGTIILVILVLLLIGAFPRWNFNRSWGYGPSGVMGVALLVIVVLVLMGRV